MKQILTITRKELGGYFGSPMALIFVGVFLTSTLFTFFWVDTFFSRGIADVRPLFNWIPVLMIFLVAALTMRQWSEEQRSGTMEILLTLPVNSVNLVAGKFVAVMALVCVALGLTVFLPITVWLLGDLDWGPVVGGYLATVLLTSAYAAIGLYVSSRTDNQLVALIMTVIVISTFYIIGSRGLTDFFDGNVSDILRALGSGARFESIERGVIDLRDLAYYLSLTGIFISLNVLQLERAGWSTGENTFFTRARHALIVAMIVVNLILLNVWLYPLRGIRVDLTEGNEYSLSNATRDILDATTEPLLIRGYFSEKTHPMLAPLVPRLRDMLQEYAVSSSGNVIVEIVDPIQDPEKEAEANQTYGIRPTPLQAADRYGASVVNSYFDILIRYGDQHMVLNFQDLIEVEGNRTGQVDVRFRNLEYDLTRSIKKAVYGFQSIESLLASLDESAKLTLFVTPNILPEGLSGAIDAVRTVADNLESISPGKFDFELVDVEANKDPQYRQNLYEQYGLQGIPVSFFSPDEYYLHMVVEVGDEAELLYPSGDFSEASVRTALEASLKRSSTGFLKVIGIWTPPDIAQQAGFGQQMPSLKEYSMVSQVLSENYTVKELELTEGFVPADVDLLVVIAPQDMSDVEIYAIDQYLMRGGSLVVSAGNFVMLPDPYTGGLGLKEVQNGLKDALASYGVDILEKLILDPQNEPFPVPVIRDISGVQIREIQAIDYPFFVDIRSNGMNSESPILASLPALTLNWASPIEIEDLDDEKHDTTVLLESSPESWVSTDTNIQPDKDQYPEFGFPVGSDRKPYITGISVVGEFVSYYADKQSPLEKIDDNTGDIINPDAVGVLESSAPDSRLVVISSAEFLNDTVLELSASMSGERYVNSLQFAQNVADWSVEDQDLLSIRSGGMSSRPLAPLSERQQVIWETINYVVAFLGLLWLSWAWHTRQKKEIPMKLLDVGDNG